MKVSIPILLSTTCIFPSTVSSKKLHGLLHDRQKKKSLLPLRLLQQVTEDTSIGAVHHENTGEILDMCSEKVATAKNKLNTDLQTLSDKISSAVADFGDLGAEESFVCELMCTSGSDSSLQTNTFDGGLVTNLLRAYLLILGLFLVSMTFRLNPMLHDVPQLALFVMFPVMFFKIIVVTILIIISWYRDGVHVASLGDDSSWKQELRVKVTEAIATVSSFADDIELEGVFDSFQYLFDDVLDTFGDLSDEDNLLTVNRLRGTANDGLNQDGDQTGPIRGELIGMVYSTLNQAGEKAEPIIGKLLGTAYHALNQRQDIISSFEDTIIGTSSEDSCVKVLVQESSSEFSAMADKLEEDLCSLCSKSHSK